jgi:hypothetical protein
MRAALHESHLADDTLTLLEGITALHLLPDNADP